MSFDGDSFTEVPMTAAEMRPVGARPAGPPPVAVVAPASSGSAWLKVLFMGFLVAAGVLMWRHWKEGAAARQAALDDGGAMPPVSSSVPPPPQDGRQYVWVEGAGWVPQGLEMGDPTRVQPGVPYAVAQGANASAVAAAAREHGQQPSMVDPRDPRGMHAQAAAQAAADGFGLRAPAAGAMPFLTGLRQ